MTQDTPYTPTDESDSEDEGVDLGILPNPDVKNDPVEEGGDGTDPKLPEEVEVTEPKVDGDDDEEGEDG